MTARPVGCQPNITGIPFAPFISGPHQPGTRPFSEKLVTESWLHGATTTPFLSRKDILSDYALGQDAWRDDQGQRLLAPRGANITRRHATTPRRTVSAYDWRFTSIEISTTRRGKPSARHGLFRPAPSPPRAPPITKTLPAFHYFYTYLSVEGLSIISARISRQAIPAGRRHNICTAFR